MSAILGVSETFEPGTWNEVPGFDDLTDVTYHRAVDAYVALTEFARGLLARLP